MVEWSEKREEKWQASSTQETVSIYAEKIRKQCRKIKNPSILDQEPQQSRLACFLTNE